MKIAFYTLGCKLNQCESEALASSFGSRGFSILRPDEEADIYVINTCTVTTKAEQKARRMIRKYSRDFPESVIIVTGCYAQMDPEDIRKLGPNVLLVSMDDKDVLLDLAPYLESEARVGALFNACKRFLEARDGISAGDIGRFRFEPEDFNYHTRASLKIQDGCDNKCAYCRVTLARGDSVSLDSREVLCRVEKLIQVGYREIVITGVNLSSYRTDEMDFAGLLEYLTENTSGCRFRLSSIEPDAVDERLAGVFKSPAVCPHFHLPVQSGADPVLKAMNRHYLTDQLEKAVNLCRSAKDDPFLAADVIVGFPGETDEDFENTYNLLKKLDFAHLHVFPFSPRPETVAFGMKNRVPERISRIRAEKLRSLSSEMYRSYLDRWNGRETDLLLEKKIERGGSSFFSGMSDNYLRAEVSCDTNMNPGEIIRITLKNEQNRLFGYPLKLK